jgi:hypothetical protein
MSILSSDSDSPQNFDLDGIWIITFGEDQYFSDQRFGRIFYFLNPVVDPLANHGQVLDPQTQGYHPGFGCSEVSISPYNHHHCILLEKAIKMVYNMPLVPNVATIM